MCPSSLSWVVINEEKNVQYVGETSHSVFVYLILLVFVTKIKTLFRCGIIYTNSINYAIGIIFPLINFNNTRACAYELCRYKPEGEISHVGIINERTTSYEIWQFNKFDARRLFPFLFRARPTFSRKLYDKLLPHLAYKWPIFITRN